MPNPNIAVVWIYKNKYRFYDMDNKKLISELENMTVKDIINTLKTNYPTMDEDNIKKQINDQNKFYNKILD